MENLALEVFDLTDSGSHFAFLPDDTSITVTDTSEIFDSGDIWTHSFKLNVFGNAHIFGTVGDIHGGRLHEQIDKRRARLWVLGIPMYYGYLKLENEVEIKENGDVDVTFESGRKTFLQMIEGAKANQVPIPDDICIGMAVDRERTVNREGTASGDGITVAVTSELIQSRWGHALGYDNCTIKGEENFAQIYPKFVQPYGDWTDEGGSSLSIARNDTVNTDNPYTDNAPSSHPYCNTRLCYQRKEYRDNNGTVEKQATRNYKFCPGARVNPSPNFYVLYWFRILMQHLGIIITENQLAGVEDLCRLFFVNTKCAYKTKDIGTYKAVDQYGRDKYMPFGPANPFVPIPTEDNPSWELKGELVEGPVVSRRETVSIADVGNYLTRNPEVTWQPAYATSDNFPNVDIKDVIESLENGFGVRMMFSENYSKVRVVLLRNIFRSTEVHELAGETISESKTENGIRGFRLTYGGSEEDTEFVYKGFKLAEKKETGGWLTEEDKHDYNQFDFTLHYGDIKNEVRVLNNTCYIDMATGNAYIVKVDKDAKNSADQFNPSLFPCADFMDAEDGDCTGDEETIREVRIGFSPIIENAIKDGSYALYVDEDMGVPFDFEGRGSGRTGIPGMESLNTNDVNCTSTKDEAQYKRGLFEIATPTSVQVYGQNGKNKFTIPLTPTEGGSGKDMTYSISISGWLREGYRLYLDDNYEPNDEMECPLEKHEWGLMLGIMRGTNAGEESSSVKYESDTDENEGNDTWEIQPGSCAIAHSDICDDNGTQWDYRPRISSSGKDFGDWVLLNAGGIPANLRGTAPGGNNGSRRGPLPTGVDTMAIIDSYYTSVCMELFVVTQQGFYAYDDIIYTKDNALHNMWLNCVDMSGVLRTYGEINKYVEYLRYGQDTTGMTDEQRMELLAESVEDIISRDATGFTFGNVTLKNMIISLPRVGDNVLQEVCEAYNHWSDMEYIVPSGEEDEQTGLISLKLRAEKPNPYYDPTRPEGKRVATTKEEAGDAMLDIFTTAHVALLNRPKVSNATMRAAGWDAQGDGYATVYSMGMAVQYDDGTMHEILWTPILPNGSVLTPSELQTYVNSFNGTAVADIAARDMQGLILDIDTTEERAQLLHELQALYYAGEGEPTSAVEIPGDNPRYLTITNPALRHRGLIDQFHKEESYYWRNGRIINKKRDMELADILSIDKTVRQKVDDVVGFVKKMQYTVNIKTGLSPVDLEIWYL